MKKKRKKWRKNSKPSSKTKAKETPSGTFFINLNRARRPKISRRLTKVQSKRSCCKSALWILLGLKQSLCLCGQICMRVKQSQPTSRPGSTTSGRAESWMKGSGGQVKIRLYLSKSRSNSNGRVNLIPT